MKKSQKDCLILKTNTTGKMYRLKKTVNNTRNKMTVMKSILRNKAVFFFKPKQGPNKFLNISS